MIKPKNLNIMQQIRTLHYPGADIVVFKYGRTTYFYPHLNSEQPINYRKIQHYIRMFLHFKTVMRKLMENIVTPDYPFTHVEKVFAPQRVTGFYYSDQLKAGIFQLSNGKSVYQDENMEWCTLPEKVKG